MTVLADNSSYGVLVQRMFVPADRVIALGIYCSYCILRRLILTELVFGGHDAQQSAATADPSSQGLAGLRSVGSTPCLALAHYAIVFARAWAADSINARVRLSAENDRLQEEYALLREEFRIKDTRIAQIAPQRRPHYGPHERMAILELRAARGWSLKQTADTFLVTPATIAAWLKRIDDQGANALLQLREPVNQFPDFVRYIVQRVPGEILIIA